MMGSFVENASNDLDSRLGIAFGVKEAPPGFEPGMKVLQTSALPLGYVAVVFGTAAEGVNLTPF